MEFRKVFNSDERTFAEYAKVLKLNQEPAHQNVERVAELDFRL